MKLRKLPPGVHPDLLHPAYASTSEGEAANQDDPVLALCGARAATLVAKRTAADANAYTWNISLQGANETVFFEA